MLKAVEIVQKPCAHGVGVGDVCDDLSVFGFATRPFTVGSMVCGAAKTTIVVSCRSFRM